MKVKKGNLWIEREWKEAIKLSLSTCDFGIEPIYKYKNPAVLLNDTKILVGYQIYGLYGNGRKYKTRIPKKLNSFVEDLLNNIGGVENEISKNKNL